MEEDIRKGEREREREEEKCRGGGREWPGERERRRVLEGGRAYSQEMSSKDSRVTVPPMARVRYCCLPLPTTHL